jgi:prepilin-type N-terminal cleavage/methylation domain-containing protein
MKDDRIKKSLKKLAAQSGMTLAEVVIVIVVSGILVVTILPFFRMNVESYVKVRFAKDMIQSSRIGFNKMIAEMQRIENSTHIDYGYANEIQFDIPGDNNITYQYLNGQLQREGVRLVEGVRGFQIRYFRSDGTEMAPPLYWDPDVWLMRVELDVGNEDYNMVLKAAVSPRKFHL